TSPATGAIAVTAPRGSRTAAGTQLAGVGQDAAHADLRQCIVPALDALPWRLRRHAAVDIIADCSRDLAHPAAAIPSQRERARDGTHSRRSGFGDVAEHSRMRSRRTGVVYRNLSADPLRQTEEEVPMSTTNQQFASDNYSGICPEVWEAMSRANQGHERAYGDDQWTARAADHFRQLFETDCEVFFAFNGTAANSLALSALCQSYHSVICADIAHVETDECGAPEFFSNGSKLLVARTEEGKLTPASIREIAQKRQDIHYPKPRVVSLTQATEIGTVYQPAVLRAISQTCKELNLHLHMDGARFANACASLDLSPAELSWKAGVDVLCFGGTKNGMAVGEAILFFNRALAEDFEYRCKQAGQLASKMRFLSAPWVGLLETGAWLKYAAHA